MQIVATNIKPIKSKLIIHHPNDLTLTTFKLPDGSDVQGILYIVGSYSDNFINATKQMNKKIEDGNDNYDVLVKSLIADCIVGWEDNGFFSNSYSPENASELLLEPDSKWLTDQIYVHIQNQSNFFLPNS